MAKKPKKTVAAKVVAKAKVVADKPPRAARKPKLRLPLIDDLPMGAAAAVVQQEPLHLPFAGILRMTDTLVARAVAAYDSLFELDRGDQADVYRKNGLQFARDGRLQEAQHALRKAIALRPDDGDLLTELGIVYLRKDAPAAAVKTFAKAQDQGANTFRLHRHLADALAQQEQYDGALAELSEANALDPSSGDTVHRIGVILDTLGRTAEARDAFEQAIERSPDEISYHQSLGFALETLGKRKEAVKRFKLALELEHRLESSSTRRARNIPFVAS